jgi:hypothetical protein
MSKQLLNNYYNKLDDSIRFGGSRNETTVEHAFIQLVNSYAERRNSMLVPKIAIRSAKGTTIIPDGALKNSLRLDFGYWESKDIKDDIDKEIQLKINRGYPLTNTLFDDSAHPDRRHFRARPYFTLKQAQYVLEAHKA